MTLGDADRFKFAWSPSGSSYLGGIVMRTKPTKSLNRLTYTHALAGRIERLIAAEEPDDALRLLARVQSEDSGISFQTNSGAAIAIAEWSEWLHAKVHFPPCGVAADELAHDAELLDQIVNDDSLEAYLNRLYDGR